MPHRLSLTLTLALALALLGAGPPAPEHAAASQAACVTFPETGQQVCDPFLSYWQAHGGLALNGYPLTEARQERLEDGKTYQVQWFERVRMEFHPEYFGTSSELLLGQFGRLIHPADPPVGALPGLRFYPETGHNVPPDFTAYWDANGGLPQFGYPLSEVFRETLEDGQVYEVQYFERARFERHPENQPPYTILLGQFGRRILGNGAAPSPAPSPAPSVAPSPSPSTAPPPSPSPSPRANCDPSYPTVCIPPPPPDLDCNQIPYRNFPVKQPDPHKFDSDKDGIGCES